MSQLAGKLLTLAKKLDAAGKKLQSPAVSHPLTSARDAADEVGKAWSGSWLGYHSRVYYAGLKPRPPGARFSMGWGLMDKFSNETVGEWCEFTFDSVRDAILSKAGVKSFDPIWDLTKQAKETFLQSREELLSIIIISLENRHDDFISRIKSQVDELEIHGTADFAEAMQPRGKFISHDQLALGEGFKVPPHYAVLAEVSALEDVPDKCIELSKTMRRAASHLKTKEDHKSAKQAVGQNVFIGHGRSDVWKDLRDFIEKRIGLRWDEFNRIPIAGKTNISRLNQMLDEAAIAFIVMTAEDEQKDGTMRARMNVIHEAGLFQGRLGFTKAILLVEEGCDEFSNIDGLGQIKFPKRNIKAAFEEVRLVLEREGLVEAVNAAKR